MFNIFRYCKKESILEKEFEYIVCKEYIKVVFCFRL